MHANPVTIMMEIFMLAFCKYVKVLRKYQYTLIERSTVKAV